MFKSETVSVNVPFCVLRYVFRILKKMQHDKAVKEFFEKLDVTH